MKCPICNDVRMREVEKNGVHIDVCPDCKGVWLDRGELEKLTTGMREVQREYDDWMLEQEREYGRNRPQPDQYGYDPKYSKYPRYPKYKKKKSFLDIFDDLF